MKINKRKRVQDYKSKISSANPKKGQEEIAGFAVILVLVGVIIVLFLGFMLIKEPKEKVDDYQVTSFIQSFLQVTTLCEQNGENLSVKDLLEECQKEADCSYGMKSCNVLNTTLSGILEESWEVGEEEVFPLQGYQLNITSYGEKMLFLKKGIITREYKGSSQSLPGEIDIHFNIYYN
jgi:hypothetical protein